MTRTPSESRSHMSVKGLLVTLAVSIAGAAIYDKKIRAKL